MRNHGATLMLRIAAFTCVGYNAFIGVAYWNATFTLAIETNQLFLWFYRRTIVAGANTSKQSGILGSEFLSGFIINCLEKSLQFRLGEIIPFKMSYSFLLLFKFTNNYCYLSLVTEIS